MLRSKATGRIDYVLKIRGMTFNMNAVEKQGLCYENTTTGTVGPIRGIYLDALRSSVVNGEVCSRRFEKVSKPYVAKGLIGHDYHV